MNKIILVGLGNPGLQYSKTIHNAGFIILAEIAKQYNATFKSKFGGELASFKLGQLAVHLFKPLSYMNNSGGPTQAVVSFCKPNKLIVIHDDIDLSNKVKIKDSGSSGGHRGLESIDRTLGNKYTRVRVGVGRPTSSVIPISDYVLSNFRSNELISLEIIGKILAESIPLFITNQYDLIVQQCNLILSSSSNV